MAVYLVTYDLKAPGKDYSKVFEYLKQFAYCKSMLSVWLVDTRMTAEQIRDGLWQLVDSNDELFVTRLALDWASLNYYCSDWLNQADREW